MDFRSRNEIEEDKRREAKQDIQIAKTNNRQIEAIDNRMTDLTRFAEATRDEMERNNGDRKLMNDEITNLKQELTSLHSMIQSSGAQDMEMVNQMNANYEKRMATLMAMIKEI